MLDALHQIVEFIGMIIDFAIQLITGLIQLLLLIPKCIQMLTGSLLFLPPFLVAFATATVTVSVIFIIVGRNGGGD